MAEGLLQGAGATTVQSPTTIDKTAQDIAKAQGVAYEGIAKQAETTTTPAYADYNATKAAEGIETLAQPKAASSYYDEAKSTVAGRLNTLLSSDSDYMKQIDNKSKEEMSRKGMLSSSAAISAGREAAYGAAMPIVTADADSYNKFGLQQQATENEQAKIQSEAIVSGEMSKQKADIAQKSQNIQNAFNSRIQGAGEESKAWLQGLSQSHQTAMQDLTHTQNLALQQFDVTSKKAESIRTNSAQIMQNYQISVENLMTDPDFLNLGSGAVNNAINQMQTLAKNSIKFLGASSGIDMGPFVDAYLTNLSVV